MPKLCKSIIYFRVPGFFSCTLVLSLCSYPSQVPFKPWVRVPSVSSVNKKGSGLALQKGCFSLDVISTWNIELLWLRNTDTHFFNSLKANVSINHLVKNLSLKSLNETWGRVGNIVFCFHCSWVTFPPYGDFLIYLKKEPYGFPRPWVSLDYHGFLCLVFKISIL